MTQGIVLNVSPENNINKNVLGINFDILVDVLKERFSNGFRLSSPLDLTRLKNICFERGCALSQSDDAVLLYVKQLGFECKGKLIPFSSQEIHKLKELFMNAISTGASIIFYNSFFDIHIDELTRILIFSPDTLSAALKTYIRDVNGASISYKKSHLTLCNEVSLSDEIARKFYSVPYLSYEELSQELPYIPLKKLRQAMVDSPNYVNVAKYCYTCIDNIKIDNTAIMNAQSFIEDEISRNGYSLLGDIDVSDLLSENPSLSEEALRAGLFVKCLKDKYVRHGNIITRKGYELHIDTLLADYIEGRDEISFSAMIEFENSLRSGNWLQSFPILLDKMVRIDGDTFVSDDHISFPVDECDKALKILCPVQYIPIKSVVGFALFPSVEYPWNLHLLESYVRRFSRMYRFDVRSPNSKHVGVIIRKDAPFASYIEVMTDALAQSDASLTVDIALNWFCEQGYIAFRSVKEIDTILRDARIIRERSR